MPRHPVPDPDDVDPTGVRELLAALPDPGPMPEDLVRRIEARLEVERAHRDGGRTGTGVVSAQADRVLDLAAERSRRRPVRMVALLGAAAAGLMVTTVAVTQLIGDGGGVADTAAVYPSRAGEPVDGAEADAAADMTQEDGDGADSGAAGVGDAPAPAAEARDEATQAESATAGAMGPQTAASLEEEAALDITILPAVPPVTPDDVADALWTALDDDDLGFRSTDLSVAEAQSCWQTLAAEHTYTDHVATRAQFVPAPGEGKPAVALLGLHADSTGEAWVMPAACTSDPSLAPLSGPHPLD